MAERQIIIMIISGIITLVMTFMQGKGKAIPLQAWTGPEDYRSLRLPDIKSIGT